eukprot:TRINITY_DN742_c0_g1_i3.p2 TRINITY_DN742_c0_g1~~TRINITY_DN742_c0_g1_i3.p2  ORF type:complete len:78 (+),score=5.01 TRINITY_DN742_c0_g1_i3:40-273(+)
MENKIGKKSNLTNVMKTISRKVREYENDCIQSFRQPTFVLKAGCIMNPSYGCMTDMGEQYKDLCSGMNAHVILTKRE